MPNRYPTETQRRTLWSALTGLAIATLGGLVVGLVLLLGQVLAYLQPVLVPLALAGILAYLLNPVVEKIEERGASRIQAILGVFVLSALLVVLGLVLIIRPATTQVAELIETREERIVKFVARVESYPWFEPALAKLKEPHPDFAEAAEQLPEGESVPFSQTRIGVWLNNLTEFLIKEGPAALFSGAGKVFGFLGYALGFLLVPVYLYFFLLETAIIKKRWSDFVPLRKSRFKEEVVATLTEMNDYLIAFFRGQVLVSIIDGVLTGLLLSLIGLPYAWVIGIALAILGVMPFIGFLVTLIPALIIAAADAESWHYPLGVFAIFVVVQQIDGLLIQPKIIGDKVGLHPMTIIFSIFFWSLLLGGFLGALLAIPLTASVKVLFTRYVWEKAGFEPSLSNEPDPPSGRAVADI